MKMLFGKIVHLTTLILSSANSSHHVNLLKKLIVCGKFITIFWENVSTGSDIHSQKRMYKVGFSFIHSVVYFPMILKKIRTKIIVSDFHTRQYPEFHIRSDSIV